MDKLPPGRCTSRSTSERQSPGTTVARYRTGGRRAHRCEDRAAADSQPCLAGRPPDPVLTDLPGHGHHRESDHSTARRNLHHTYLDLQRHQVFEGVASDGGARAGAVPTADGRAHLRVAALPSKGALLQPRAPLVGLDGCRADAAGGLQLYLSAWPRPTRSRPAHRHPFAAGDDLLRRAGLQGALCPLNTLPRLGASDRGWAALYDSAGALADLGLLALHDVWDRALTGTRFVTSAAFAGALTALAAATWRRLALLLAAVAGAAGVSLGASGDQASARGCPCTRTPGTCASRASSQRPPAGPSPRPSRAASSSAWPATRASQARARRRQGMATSPSRCWSRAGEYQTTTSRSLA